MSRALLKNNSLLEMYGDGNRISLVRAFKYGALQASNSDVSDPHNMPKPPVIGSSPHTDWGWLTLILAFEQEPALQFSASRSDPSWVTIPAHPVSGSRQLDSPHFVVNTGDYLAGLGYGIHSPLHRVLTTSSERTSLVFFGYPSYNSPLPARTQSSSLFMDQSDGKEDSPEASNFGELLTQKWKSVQRY
jgi:isopenicillin N synthase-like dioxygenase